MLASIIKTPIAAKISITIMDAFVVMRHYIGNNECRLFNIETKIIEHDTSIAFLKESFGIFFENKKVSEIYFKVQIYDSHSKI